MSIVTKIFGTRSERQVKKMNPIIAKIEALSDHYASLSEAELRGTTQVLKDRLAARRNPRRYPARRLCRRA